jgi:hypothetical protein
MRLLIILMLCTSAQCADYPGKVKINNEVAGSIRVFSGTVYDMDDTNYYVVSCAHGVNDLSEEKRSLSATLFGRDEITVPLIILSEDINRDISIMIFQHTKDIDVKPYQLAESDCPVGTVCDTEGFIPSLTRRKVSINSYTMISSHGENLTQCVGRVEKGMSGCGLMHDDKIYGVLSGKDDAGDTCVFASLSQIKTVIGKME